MGPMIPFAGVGLRNEYLVLQTMPDAGPSLVRPAQTEWKFWLAGRDDFVKGSVEKAFARKPIMVVAKSLYAETFGHLGLLRPCFRYPQVIKAKIRRHMRLIMPTKQRSRLRRVGPFCKTCAPPRIIFGYRMKLRQVERHHTCLLHAIPCQATFHRAAWYPQRPTRVYTTAFIRIVYAFTQASAC